MTTQTLPYDPTRYLVRYSAKPRHRCQTCRDEGTYDLLPMKRFDHVQLNQVCPCPAGAAYTACAVPGCDTLAGASGLCAGCEVRG